LILRFEMSPTPCYCWYSWRLSVDWSFKTMELGILWV